MSELDNRLKDILNSVKGYRDIEGMKEMFISLLFLKYANDNYKPKEYNVIEIPENARWAYLYSTVGSPYLQDELNKAFFLLENANSQIRNTVCNFNFNSNRNHLQQLEFLYHLFITFSKIDFQKIELSFSDILEKLLANFANYEGKKGGDFTTPHSVSKLMTKLLEPKGGTVLDSTCGIGGYFSSIEENYSENQFQFYGQEYNSSTLAIAKLRFAFNEKNIFQFGDSANTLINDSFPNLKADFVIMHPPFNVRLRGNELNSSDPRFEFGLPPKSNADFAWIQHALSHLNNEGKATLLLNVGTLFRGGKDGEIRKNLIEADLVEAIITLPSRLLANTSIPSSIWIFSKKKPLNKKVILIDASDLGKMINKGQRELNEDSIQKIVTHYTKWKVGETQISSIGFSNSVDIKRIAENDYILTPQRYLNLDYLSTVKLDHEPGNIVSLGEILTYVSPTKSKLKDNIKKVSIKDLSSNPDSYILKTDNLSEVGKSPNYSILQNDVLLLSKLSTNLKPTFYSSNTEKVAYSVNAIYSFKVDENRVDMDYLVAELHKDYIKAELERYSMGSVMRTISRKDLLKILISIPPSLKEQKEIIEKEREVRFQSAAKDLGFEKEIAKLKLAQMKDLGSKKHNIMQHLNNVKASADVLTKMMKLNNGILKSDEIIDPRRGVTVEKRFHRLQESLSKVIYYVDNITNELKYDVAEIINPAKFIKECKERGIQNESFTVEVIIEKTSFEGREPLISISKNDFEEIYNNILENSINHGFVDDNKKYILRITIAFIDDFLEINFENNGKPFPKGIAQKFDVKGEKAGITAGTGIGLWKVSEIAKHFGAIMSVFDEPTADFPVGYNFKFNLETL
ncbi:N-6 DNA methylase [Maribacter ulvicola]|uniref:site-specific DNA-methyltransferase (adenine-specific) n=1 Tax=Maribacter ulvicola TaxID=228959 RepID=A0A1N6WSM4_9FLAO|nr:N-6 DNA methylase [Maribacter ulvicola]SIQ93011.1 Type I restriction-modification system, DNA methylase subunit [Maribacter ulvicola]